MRIDKQANAMGILGWKHCTHDSELQSERQPSKGIFS